MKRISKLNMPAVHCDSCNLHSICLPKGLSEQELERLNDFIERPKSIKADKLVYKPSDSLTHLYAVRSGVVKTYLINKKGDHQIIGFHLPGEVFGLDGMQNKVHQCYAKTIVQTSVCELPHDKLKDICNNIPSMQEQVFSLISLEMNNDQAHLLLLGQQTAKEKIATFILSLSKRFEERGFSARELNLSMSRQDIANYLGITIETVSRTFRFFDDEKILEVNHRNVTILEREKLTDCVEECRGNKNFK